MKRCLLLFFLWPVLVLSAQDSLDVASKVRAPRLKHFVGVIDSVLMQRSAKISTDTNFVAKPTETWTLRPKTDIFGNDLFLRGGTDASVRSRYKLTADVKETMGITISYRGISLSISVNPRRLAGLNSSTQYCLNYYYNRYGLDITYNNLYNFTVRNHERTILDGSSAHLRNLSFNAYWVFNGQRFSYPAAFDQSMIQRRSSGSLLAGTMFYIGNLNTDIAYKEEDVFHLHGLRMRHLMVGCGYGYNFVPSSHWLIHISAVPYVMVWRKYDVRYSLTAAAEAESARLRWRYPEISGIGRAAVVYRWKKYFIGFTLYGQLGRVGTNDTFSLINTQWKMCLFWGVRLSKKPK